MLINGNEHTHSDIYIYSKPSRVSSSLIGVFFHTALCHQPVGPVVRVFASSSHTETQKIVLDAALH